jgi:branched-chain amino acid transport system permease protein
VVVFSNILQAIFRPGTQSETFLISANAGPSTFAAKARGRCAPAAHFIMITLAFGQMASFIASSLSLLGGDDGYTLFGRTEWFGTGVLQNRPIFYFVCFDLQLIVWLFFPVLLDSRFGRVLRAAKQNPLRVEALGFSPYPYRLGAYPIASAIGGLAGAL